MLRRSSSHRFLVFFLLVTSVFVGSAQARAAGDEGRPLLVVELLPDAREIGSDALREAIAEELEVEAIAEDDPRAAAAPRTLVVGEDRPKNELFVELREGGAAIVRHVPLPRDARTARKTAVFLAGNMARNEAGELVEERARRNREEEGGHAREAASVAPPDERADKEAAPPREPPARRFWIGVHGELDLQMLPGADDVCLLGSDALTVSGYACVNPDGSDYPTRASREENDLIVPGRSDKVAGGLAPGNRRVGVSLDVALTGNLLAGARVAYVLGRPPSSGPSVAAAGTARGATWSALHVELRATYVLGERPLSSAGLAPYALLGAGLGEFDARVAVSMIEKGTSSARSVDAWKSESPFFVTAGLGLRWALTPNAALLIAPLKATLSLRHATPILSPELGFQIAL